MVALTQQTGPVERDRRLASGHLTHFSVSELFSASFYFHYYFVVAEDKRSRTENRLKSSQRLRIDTKKAADKATVGGKCRLVQHMFTLYSVT